MLTITACGGDDDFGDADAESPTTRESTSSTSSDATARVVDHELEDFEPRSVTFGNLLFEIDGAHLTNQDLRSYADESESIVDAGGDTFAILDIRVTNTTGNTQIGFDAEYFNLEIDGETTPVEDPFLSEVIGFQSPNASQESFLAFAVADDVDLGDAALVIGAPPDRQVRVPLIGEADTSGYPIELDEQGAATGTGPTNGGTLTFTVLGGSIALDLPHERVTSPTGQRADEGEVFLQLHVVVEKTEGRGGDVLGPSDAFRLLVDDSPSAPFDVAISESGSNETPTAEPGAAVDAWVLFVLPTDAESVALQVGKFDSDPGVIPLELPVLPER